MNIRAAWALAVTVFGWVSAPAHADAVDDFVRRQMALQHIPGLSLAVIKEGKVIKAKGYGFANLEGKVRATADTAYEIGSVTKQFTAAAILLLAQEKKVGLDDALSKYLADLPDTWKAITVRQLLTHTSGIPDYTRVADFGKRTLVPATPAEVLQTVAGAPLDFLPGERWGYSNTGYFLLGLIVEKASGQPYAEFLRERLFKPLHMDATRVNDLKTLVPDRASGYDWDGAGFVNAPRVSMTWPFAAGAVLSTVRDLAKWDAALYAESPLPETLRRAMWSPVTLNDGATFPYGFGWFVETVGGYAQQSHGGGIPGFTSHIVRYPAAGVSVCVLLNSGARAERIAQRIARMYIPALAPPTGNGIRLPAEKLTAYAGYYSTAFNSLVEIRAEGGRITLVAPFLSPSPVEWRAEGEAAFFSPDVLERLTFTRGADGAASALRLARDGRVQSFPRVGPLVTNLPSKTGPPPVSTEQALAFLKALSAGGQALQDADVVTPGAKRDFKDAPMPEVADLSGLTYLAVADVEGRGIERHGGRVSRVLYYRLGPKTARKYALLYLTADNLFTDIDVVTL